MELREMEMYQRELTEILEKIDKEKPDHASSDKLHQLALKVGACTVEYAWTSSGAKWSRATVEKLAYNIHQALQTASMIDASRTASKNHYVSIAAATIAVVAALAAWAGVILTTICRG